MGVSVHDRNLSDVLVDKATHILDDHARAVADVRDRQNALWQVTRGNLEVLEKTFDPTARAHRAVDATGSGSSGAGDGAVDWTGSPSAAATVPAAARRRAA